MLDCVLNGFKRFILKCRDEMGRYSVDKVFLFVLIWEK